MTEQVQESVESFDLTDYLSGHSKRPTDSVTVYLDAEAAYELEALKERHNRETRKGGPKSITGDDASDIEDEIAALQEKVKGSALTVVMRAMNSPEREIIEKKVKKKIPLPKDTPANQREDLEDRRSETVTMEWLATATLKIVRPDGAEVTGIEREHMEAVRTSLYDTEWGKVEALFSRLSFTAGLVDRAIDAGFPSGASA